MARAASITPRKYRAYVRADLDSIPEMGCLSPEQRLEMKAVSAVLPFRVNEYVVEELIDWQRIPEDPMYQLTFPQPGMLAKKDLERMRDLVRKDGSETEIRSAARAIQMRINPHPAGQMELNVPVFEGEPVPGIQHKDRETVLFFPSQGQTCHAYCTYCFRWAQFVGIDELKFAGREARTLAGYLREHPEVQSVLFRKRQEGFDMNGRLSRRALMQAAGMAAIATPVRALATGAVPGAKEQEIPKICLPAGLGSSAPGAAGDEASARRIRQLGVEHVISGGSRIPWEADRLKEMMDRLKANGLILGNLMIFGFNGAIYARPGRDEEIQKVIQSIHAAGKAGLPVIEYNWYAHRAMEGYFEETGRAGAGMTGFDYERMKCLPPLPDEGAHTLEEMWTNITYFLKAVIPAAGRGRLAVDDREARRLW